MRPLILRLFSGAKLLLMFELNKLLFLNLNDLPGFAGGKLKVEIRSLAWKAKNGQMDA